MDWKQIEKDFKKYWYENKSVNVIDVLDFFKQRIESEQPPPPKLNEEEKNEFNTTDFTVDNIKANYGN